jgi:hypothetical protein
MSVTQVILTQFSQPLEMVYVSVMSVSVALSVSVAGVDEIYIMYNASLSLVDVHIVRTGGSNNFSLSYGGSKRGV